MNEKDGDVTIIRVLTKYIVELVVGSAIFFILAIVAVGIGYFSKFISDGMTLPYIAKALSAVELAIFALDVVFFLVYTINITLKTLKELRRLP